MAKRKQTHWAVRRKNKQARTEGDDHGDGERRDRPRKNEGVDRRAGFSESIHPGSYAAIRKAEVAAKSEETAVAAAVPAEAAVDANATAEEKAPKRRYGIWLAFCGKNYSGMQMNEGVKTIEAEVERALFEAGGIAEANYGFLQKVGWSRAARTDKGVHAAGQMLTAKLQVGDDIPAFMAKANAALPEDIRIMNMVTVTKNFNAKMACDQRTYEYLAPTFIFGKRTRSAASLAASSAGEWPTNLHDAEEEINADIEITPETLKQHQEFRMDDETHALLNKALREFEGTHNFHNFTSKLEPTSPKCNRYITSFAAEKPFVENNMEWIRLRVVGQSFLLHHIRKMIGTAVEIVAGISDISIIDKATQLDKMDLPKAPSVGLYLAQAHFKIYNLKMKDSIQTSHPPLDLEDPQVAAAVEKFKRDFIFDHIIKHEETTRTYAKWLRTLEMLPFDYVAKPYAVWKKEKEELAALTDRAGKREAVKAAALRAAQEAEAQAKGETVTETTTKPTAKAEEETAEMVAPPRGELSDTALKLSQVIEREAKRSNRSSRKWSESSRTESSKRITPPATAVQRLWLLMDDPQSSQAARYLSVGIFCFVIVSTIVFIAQTEDGLAIYAQELDLIEMICAAVFSLELVVRIVACPSKRAFLKDHANWIDISAIFPFYLERILEVDNADTFGAISMKALSMLIFLMAIAMIVFSSMIYFAEFTHDGCRAGGWVGNCSSGGSVVFASSIAGAAATRAASSTDCVCVDPNPYKSIASSFWWCIVAMSAVGYGDMTPVTLMGKIVGCASVLTGMLVLALPITVIGTNFQKVVKSVMQQTMKSNVDYLKSKRVVCRNEIEAILQRFHAVTEDIHLDVDDVISVYDEDNNGMLEDEELAKFRIDLEILQNRFMMNQHSGGGGGGSPTEVSSLQHASRPCPDDTGSTWTLGSSLQQTRFYCHSPALIHSSTSRALARPASGLLATAKSSRVVALRRSSAMAVVGPSPSLGPGTVMVSREIRSSSVCTTSSFQHRGSEASVSKTPAYPAEQQQQQ